MIQQYRKRLIRARPGRGTVHLPTTKQDNIVSQKTVLRLLCLLSLYTFSIQRFLLSILALQAEFPKTDREAQNIKYHSLLRDKKEK